MFDVETKLNEIVSLIRLKLEGVDDDLVSFQPEDLKEIGVDQSHLYQLLMMLKNNGLIKSIEVNDIDEPFPRGDGTYTHISENPELFPGIFVIQVTKELYNQTGNMAVSKITIYIDKKHGIYLNKNTKEPIYNIRSDSGRFKIIKALKNSRSLRGDKLYEAMKQGQDCPPIEENDNNARSARAVIVTNAVNKINELIKENLEIDKDFIINIGSSGYTINTGEFNPKYR